MSHYSAEYLAEAKAELLDYRTKHGLYDMYKKSNDVEYTGTKCDRNKAPESLSDAVSSPNHYLKLGYECIEIIASSLSKEAFKGYCMGNFLKYRFRMGDKGDMLEDFEKSKEYLMLYDKYSHLCKDVPF